MWSVLAVVLAVNPHLEEGRQLYEKLKYPEAEARLKVAATVPGLSAAEQAETLDLLARAMLAQGRTADAERTYGELLAAQPHVDDPQASPKVKAAFLRAKKSVYPEGFVRLVRGPAAPGQLELELVDPWRSVRTVAMELRRGEGAWSLRELTANGRRYSVAMEPGPGEKVSCAVKATDEGGRVLATLGRREEPIVFEAAAAQAVTIATPVGEPVATDPARWPAILLGSVALAALAAGTVLAISSAGDYGQVTPMTPALDTRTLDARARDKALAANFAIGGGIAAGLVAAVLIWRW
jgi:hypothetical protein